MYELVTLISLVNQVSGTPYVPGGNSPAGTDCSGLASWVANAASGRPVYSERFNTGNQEKALLARGFKYGTQPGTLVIGWNRGHTAVTLPDGTPVSSGENGKGVRIGGLGAYQPQFTRHMYLPIEAVKSDEAAPAPAPDVVPVAFAPVDPAIPPPPPPPAMAAPEVPPPALPGVPPPPVPVPDAEL